MLTPLLAGAVSALALAYSVHVLRRSACSVRQLHTELDELELRLAERRLVLELGLGRRTLRALARATLFAGTGLAVWDLTGGSANYLTAGTCFVLGFVGWAGCSEIERRFSALPSLRRRYPGALSVAGPERPTADEASKPTR